MQQKFIPILKSPEAIKAKTGVDVHPDTVKKWMTRGVRGVVLNTRCVGGRRFVTEEDLTAFFDRCAGADTARSLTQF